MPFTFAERLVTIVIVDTLAMTSLAACGVHPAWWGAAAIGALGGILVIAYAALWNEVVR